MNRETYNNVLDTDSYKFSHFAQYPPNTTNIFSYIEARGSKIEGVNATVFFGLQYILGKYFTTPITMEDVEEAAEFANRHLVPFNREGWEHIVNKHEGHLPVRIRAVPEGTAVPIGNVMLTIENTDPECFWLTSYLETALMRLWFPCTVATISRHVKEIINEYLEKTADDAPSEIPFKLHDFGSRGVSCQEQAALGGAAHLVNFSGTDTVVGMLLALDWYSANPENVGFSIPAAEHSTMTAWGEENEQAAYQNMIDQYAEPGAIFAVVSDSYDIWNAVENIWCGKGNLVQQVKERGATVVIRPDSGDPVMTPVKVIQKLMAQLSHDVRVNGKGYKVLPDYVRVIQGDGIGPKDIREILELMKTLKLSASNITFGMGGGLLQKCNRDTFKFAMKCSSRVTDGVEYGVSKNPVGDKSKASKAGRLTLVRDPNTQELFTCLESDVDVNDHQVMRVVYENGFLKRFSTFEEIRNETNEGVVNGA